ncbi:SufE family protein [Prosthecomicrobium hirschii]|uniref:Cysteine desufuration protein SufE n=1 Tax=Prosthecodimorpha hirschii TaxID=665126 RepID=A0A0P6VZA5_9HYPH|nr:SufE family protein [Prosthecomicrobium hirschii]KPL52060.1 cysteine desufuration protein SufE [Prosthecomicrobium hirschii]MCW1843570.1 SufE family protein [Prosthecomicrobium hirschii]
MATIDDILLDFETIDDWEERYRYLIELGRALPAMSPSGHDEANKVRGCASQVWLETSIERPDGGVPVLTFRGDSDAHIVKGLVAVILALFSGRTATEILSLDPEATFKSLSLREHLTPQRSNGVNSMVERIRRDARAAAAAA